MKSPSNERPQVHFFGRSAILKNIGWLSFDKVVRLGFGLFLGVWVARYLGPDQFGTLNFAIAFVSLFAALPVLGLHTILVKEYVAAREDVGQTVGTSVGLQLTAGLLAMALAIAAISFARPGDAEMRLIVAILSLLLPTRAISSIEAWYESTMQAKIIVRCQLTGFAVFAAVKILLLINEAELIFFVATVVGEAIFTAGCLFSVFCRKVAGLVEWRFSNARAKHLLRSSVYLVLSSVAVTIYLRVDQVMLGEMVDSSAVGIYSAAVRISEIWYLIPTMIVASITPNLFKAKHLSQPEFLGQFQNLFNALSVLTLAIAAFISLLATPITSLLFGEEYAGAGPILAVHIWALPFVALGMASGPWFVLQNRQDLAFKRTALGLLMNILLNLLLIPPFGGFGAAVATLISYATSGMLADAFTATTRTMFAMKLKSFNIPKTIATLRST